MSELHTTEVSYDPDTAILRLDGELTIYQVAAVRRRLLAVLRDAARLEIDLSRVSDIDSAGLQLLVALLTECTLCGVPVALRRSSTVVEELTDLYRFPLAAPTLAGSVPPLM